MKVVQTGREVMTTRWRSRRLCELVGSESTAAAIRDVSARGAVLQTDQRPPIGSTVQLRHPHAGDISAIVSSHLGDGLGIDFALGSRSAAFALAAITADMSRPAGG